MTDVATAVPDPVDPPPASNRNRTLTIAVLVSVLVALGITIVLTRWWRRGGPRRAIQELAEDGAVKLADVILDEVLPAA
jgi:hypothetical protein